MYMVSGPSQGELNRLIYCLNGVFNQFKVGYASRSLLQNSIDELRSVAEDLTKLADKIEKRAEHEQSI